MKRNKPWIVLLVFCLILAVAAPVLADVGGGVDWDYDGGGTDWNYGGGTGWNSNWDYDSDWDDSDSDFYEFIYLPYYLLRMGPVGFLIFAGLLLFLLRSRKRNNRKNRANSAARKAKAQADARAAFTHQEADLTLLLQRDPNFSKAAFLARVSDIFVTLQNAWMKKEWKSMRAFETNHLFHQHERQLQQFVERKQTNVIEDLAVLETSLASYQEDAQHQMLSAILRARSRDYLIDDETKKVLKGDPKKRYIMTYRLEFLRKIDAKTENSNVTAATQCPNCGANLSINQNGVCEYCGSEVTTGATDWVLNALIPLHQEIL